MSRVSFLVNSAVVTTAMGILAPAAASAADFDFYEQPPVHRPYAPAPPPVIQYERQTYAAPPVLPHEMPVRRHVQIDPDGCRIIVRRYQDSYGRDVTRQTRDCAERDYSAVIPRPAYPHDRYRPYDANPRPDMPDADDFD